MSGPLVHLSFALLLAGLGDATKVELKPATVEAFDTYMRSAEARIEKQVSSGTFLSVDGSAQRLQQVRQGKVLAEPVVDKGELGIPDGLVHDWTGAVFVPGATMAKTVAVMQDYDNNKIVYKPEVVDSKLLRRDGEDFKIFLRLLKKQVLTVVLNSNHDVHYTRVDEKRWHSRSRSTRIAEVENAGTPGERELPPGKDHGFLWALNTYWRFLERDGGVYVECEAISLTRDVPAGLGWLINPIIQKLPKDSLVNTLKESRDAVLRKG